MLIPDSRPLNLAEEDFKNISENKDESIRTCYLDDVRTTRNRSKTETPKTSTRDRLLALDDGFDTPSPSKRLHDRIKEAQYKEYPTLKRKASVDHIVNDSDLKSDEILQLKEQFMPIRRQSEAV